MNLNSFKAYDVRGKVPSELNEDLAYQIGVAYAKITKAKSVILGQDVRLTSPMIKGAVMRGLNDMGVNILDIGLCGTEEIYYRCFADQDWIDGGIMVTASHNPKDYNGLKMVGKGAKPISLEGELGEIKSLIEKQQIANILTENANRNFQNQTDFSKENYVKHLLSYVDLEALKSFKILVNPGNSAAGLILKELEKSLPFELIYINEQPDGNFPKGVPNPMIKDNRYETSAKIKEHGADLGIAWDGDFDRCFLFDEQGEFIEGYYVVGLLAACLLQKYPEQKIIHDARLVWDIIDLVKKHGGEPIQSKAGHSFIKNLMRQENALYGGEISGHYYFREFGYCDSGMIPWLLMMELLSKRSVSLSSLIAERKKLFLCSEEINYQTDKYEMIKAKCLEKFSASCRKIELIDGLSMEFENWRFNLRPSNTEPLIRLNVEIIQGQVDLDSCIKKIEDIIYYIS